jgi:hypothetical protein
MGNIEDQVNELSIAVIHHSIQTLSNIDSTRQKEIPVVHSTIKSLPPTIDKERAFLFCYVQAEIQYHLACAAAEKKLAADLALCSRLIAPPRPSRARKPVKRARPKK